MTNTSASTAHRAPAGALTSAVGVLTASSVHEFAVPIVRETPPARQEPAWVTTMW
jgi:hypothetical protein